MWIGKRENVTNPNHRKLKFLPLMLFLVCLMLVAVHKRRPQPGGVRPVRTMGREFFRRGRPHFLEQKGPDFSKFMVCPYGQAGDSASADILWTKG